MNASNDRTDYDEHEPIAAELQDVLSRALSVIELSDSADEHTALTAQLRALTGWIDAARFSSGDVIFRATA